MELARGLVTDRPWGQTLGALGHRRLTGQLTVFADDGKDYVIAFERGAIVGATSPLVSDSAARIALTNHLITSSVVPEIARRLAADPQRDEIDTIADACRLTPEQIYRLRQRVIAQRAARTFSVERGSFVVDDEVTIPASLAAAIDFRAVVYLGVRLNLSEPRLAADLRQLGSRFVLRADAIGDLSQFGLTSAEAPILERLEHGTTLPELEAKHREIDPRTARSVIYALVACFAADASHAEAPPAAARPTPAANPAPPRDVAIQFKPGPRTSTIDRTPIPVRQEPDALPRTVTGPRDLAARVADASSPRVRAPSDPLVSEPRTRTTGERPAVTRSPTGPNASIDRTPVPSRTSTTSPPRASSDSGGHSAVPVYMPGRNTTPPQPSPPRSGSATRSGPHPTAAPVPGGKGSGPIPVPASGRTPTPAQPVLARTQSPTQTSPTPARTLTPPGVPRTGTDRTPKHDPEPPPSGEQPALDPITAAAEAFARGKSALKAEQMLLAIDELSKATALDPNEVDYQAMLAWAQFCAASDKHKIADRTRKVLTHAIQKSKYPEMSRFYLGRVERMLGRDREALRHFQEVLELQPRNADARSEIRLIEMRIAAGSAEKPGLSSLFSRKKP